MAHFTRPHARISYITVYVHRGLCCIHKVITVSTKPTRTLHWTITVTVQLSAVNLFIIFCLPADIMKTMTAKK